MRKVQLGIIGLGNMGSAHCRFILDVETPEIELAAVADREESRQTWLKRTCLTACRCLMRAAR